MPYHKSILIEHSDKFNTTNYVREYKFVSYSTYSKEFIFFDILIYKNVQNGCKLNLCIQIFTEMKFSAVETS
jgi:hypothetical protein